MLNKLFELDPGNATSYDMLVSYISAAFANRELSASAQSQEKKPVVKKQTHDNLCTSFLNLQDSTFSYFIEYICLTFELKSVLRIELHQTHEAENRKLTDHVENGTMKSKFHIVLHQTYEEHYFHNQQACILC
jgi:hypothetical protein